MLVFRFVIVCTIASLSTTQEEEACPTSEHLPDFIDAFREECQKNDTIYGDPPGPDTCPVTADVINWICWPTTKKNTTRKAGCRPIHSNIEDFESRKCQENGRWQFKFILTTCKRKPNAELQLGLFEEAIRYNVCTRAEVNKTIDIRNNATNSTNTTSRPIGSLQCDDDFAKLTYRLIVILRSIDSAVVLVSLVILCALISWKNKRVMIHKNLLLSFLINNILTIALYATQLESDCLSIVWGAVDEHKDCSVLYMISRYFILAQVCWMFNAGFSRFNTFFFAYSTKKRFWSYLFFGWGFPAVMFGIYLAVMLTYPPVEDYRQCWFQYSDYKYTFIIWAPIMLLLLMNVLIILYILWIVVEKLRRDKLDETTKLIKAFRGFSVLLILLGGGYMITIVGPDNDGYAIFRIVLNSTQGTLISIFFVFLSKEVNDSFQNKQRKHKSKQFDGRATKSNSKSGPEGYAYYNKRFSVFERKASAASIDANIGSSNDVIGNNWVKEHVINEETEQTDLSEENSVDVKDEKSETTDVIINVNTDYNDNDVKDDVSNSNDVNENDVIASDTTTPNSSLDSSDTSDEMKETKQLQVDNVSSGYSSDSSEEKPGSLKKKDTENSPLSSETNMLHPAALISPGGDIIFGNIELSTRKPII